MVMDWSMKQLENTIRNCTNCPLYETRIKAVPGEGPSNPKIMLIGEGPGRNEDEQGRPFCGAAGKQLNGFLEQAGLFRKDIFITSIIKCRPPNNRVPKMEEANACKKWLFKQIQILKPKIIGLMGRTAVQHLLESKIDLAKQHGTIVVHNNQPFMILYHPAAVIYNQSLEQTIAEDFKALSREV
jgi:DNA polymerase